MVLLLALIAALAIVGILALVTPVFRPGFWHQVVDLVEARDKFVVATSTVVIALFTLALFIATGALWRGGEKHSERALRAYVGSEIAAWRWPLGGKIGVQLALINHGQTPARKVQLTGDLELWPFPLPQGHLLPATAATIPQSLTAYPGKTTDPAKGWIESKRPFTPAEIAEFTTPGGRYLYLFGRITYEDVFDEKRETVFCYFMDPLSIQRDANGNIATWVWAVTLENNDFR